MCGIHHRFHIRRGKIFGILRILAKLAEEVVGGNLSYFFVHVPAHHNGSEEIIPFHHRLWITHVNMSFQSSGSQQSLVDFIRSRSGCNYENLIGIFALLGSIEQREQLVDNSVGDSRMIGSSLGCERIKLVEEYQRRGCRRGSCEQLADFRFRGADIAIEEFWSVTRYQVQVAFLGQRRNDEALARTREPKEQYARWKSDGGFGVYSLELDWVDYDIMESLFRFIQSSDG
mmetsp:Transcript_7438/g.15910  ORF Transcript_7438/g.15910 Transcript_7438/m.15910 type:complete len:230 (-) Transcript_7438:3058-3747(-)